MPGWCRCLVSTAVNRTRRRFAEVVRAADVDLAHACLLIAAEEEPDLDVSFWLRALDNLAAGVSTRSSGRAVDRLRGVLSDFSGDPHVAADLRASLLPDVLRRRRGLPILLSVVWLEVAGRAGIPAYGVGLPGHFVVGLGDPDGYHELVDPWRGGASLSGQAARRIAETAGVPFHPGLLRPWEPLEVLQRILTNIRVWADRPERWRTRLWAVDLALLLPRHPVGLRRERGTLLIRLGDFRGGARELEAYAEAVEPVAPEEAETARREAHSSRARLN